MRTGYVVRRGNIFHFRVMVPSDLVAAVGRREFRISLHESRTHHATRKASVLALHSHGFFGTLRLAMKHLSPDQVAALVADWRKRMFERDAEIRRAIEVQLAPYSLPDYAVNCEAVSDSMYDRLRKLVSPLASTTPFDEDREPAPTPAERAEALRETCDLMAITDEVGADLVAVVDRPTLDSFDELSKRDLAKHYLIEAGRVFNEKADLCAGITVAPAARTSAIAQPLPQTTSAPSAVSPSPNLSVAWASYRDEKARTSAAWRGKVPEKAELAFRDLAELLGDLPVANLSRAHGTRFRDFQEKRPTGSLVTYRGMTATQLEAIDIPEDARQSGQNAQAKLDYMSAFFTWCTHEEMLTRNPLAGLSTGKAEREPVQAWTNDEVQKLLDVDNIQAFAGSTKFGANVGYLPWLMVLGTYTGARMGEILGLRLDDFHLCDEHTTERDVPVVVVDETEERSLKTNNARRKIPLHPDLAALGLWEYIAARRAAGHSLLLDCPTKGGKRTKSATRHFNTYSTRVGVARHRIKVFHSFRHTFKTSLEGYLPKSDVDLVVGHSREDSAGDTYTHALKVPVGRHADGISRLSWGLDLKSLRSLLLSQRT